jgi:hypothetical protein
VLESVRVDVSFHGGENRVHFVITDALVGRYTRAVVTRSGGECAPLPALRQVSEQADKVVVMAMCCALCGMLNLLNAGIDRRR